MHHMATERWTAYWTMAPRHGILRTEAARTPGPDEALVRTICSHCKRPSTQVTAEMLEESGLEPGLLARGVFYEGEGCLECGGTGYKGRTAICELLDLSDRIRDLILDRRPTSEIKKAARDEGMRFLRDSAVEQVLLGRTTLREINKVTFVE